MKPRIVTLTGPSCAGTTTLEGLLIESGFINAVSTTSRPMRHGEVDGVNYYFTTRRSMEEMNERGQMVELVQFDGNLYGLSAAEATRIAATGKPLVLVCEPHGREQIEGFCAEHGWDLTKVYVGQTPEVIAERFLKRFADEVVIKNRVGVIQRYASRLATMMTTELDWVEERECDIYDTAYDLKIDAFGPDTQEWAVETILKLAKVS